MEIERVTNVDDPLVRSFSRLIPQLTGKEKYPSREALEEVVKSENSYLLIATIDGEVTGSLTLLFNRLVTGLKGWIEDVVVDEAARGKGVATALIWHALKIAEENEVLHVDLTSQPVREAANRLYLKLGFTRRETNVYRYYFH